MKTLVTFIKFHRVIQMASCDQIGDQYHWLNFSWIINEFEKVLSATGYQWHQGYLKDPSWGLCYLWSMLMICQTTYFAVVNACSRYNAISNLTNQCSLLMTVRYIFWDQWGWPPMNGEPCAHDIWWTLDFTSAFLSPGVNSRAELVPSHGASRRRLGENWET
jgi:hypothetical protein